MFSFLMLVLATVVCTLWLWNRWHFSYWQRRGVRSLPATPFVGNVLDLLLYRCCFGDQFKRLYRHQAAINAPFVGVHVLHNHALLLREPALIQRVLVTDFSAFASRFETADAAADAMGSLNLFFAKYEIWKDIHSIFSTLFAWGKVRQMYPLLEQIGYNLEAHLDALPHTPYESDSIKDVAAIAGATDTTAVITEVKEMCALFTTDLIASLAFGVQANSLRNPQAEFRRMCIEVNEPRPLRILHLFTMFFFPQLVGRFVRTHLYSPEYERFMRQSIDFVIAERERSGERRNDLIDIFVALKRDGDGGVHAHKRVLQREDFFVAQAAFLLLAGFDTSSSTITFALYELARHPAVQQRLRAELREALAGDGGCLRYETVQSLEYLRQVVDEVLRLYPATSFLDRCCTAPQGYTLRADGVPDCHIPNGTPVYISVLGLHHDERFWPEPMKFDPERFSVERRKEHKPCAYLPFGAGPRGCMGSVLGLLQVKIGLIHILKQYVVVPCERTLPEMKFDPKTFVLAADGGTYLRFIKDELHTKKTHYDIM